MSKVIKTFAIERKGDWITASTPAFDRDSDRVTPTGIKTNNFERNPALFFGHNYTDAWALIGHVAEWKVTPEGMVFRPELRQPVNESDPMTIIKSLWDSNLLRAASIGFIPLKGTKNEKGGMDYSEVELLEISLVGLPANQEAIRLTMKAMSKLGGSLKMRTKSPDYRLPDETVDACNARKVPELMDGGMSQEEAVAEAARLCAQEAPADQPADAPAPDAPSQDEQANAKAEGDVVAVLDEIEAMFGKLRDLLAPSDAPAPDAPAPMDEPMQEGKGYIAKRGRVLSAGNEGKLRTAHVAIGEVLSQLGEAAPEQAAPADEGDKAKGAQLMKELAAVLGDLPKIYKK